MYTNSNKYNYRLQSGFTLIELLVVIAIVGILASLTLQNFREYQIRANIAVQKQLMHNLTTAFQARDDQITSIADGARRLAQSGLYQSGWSLENITSSDQLVPGISPSDHFTLRAVEFNCGPASASTCVTEETRVYNCQTGDVLYRYVRKNGTVVDTSYYAGAWLTSGCRR